MYISYFVQKIIIIIYNVFICINNIYIYNNNFTSIIITLFNSVQKITNPLIHLLHETPISLIHCIRYINSLFQSKHKHK